MTETRKQIIGLIEPYMDKTLSEGCLSYVNDNDNLYIAKQIIWDTDINFIWDIYIIDSIDNTWDTLYKDRYVNVYYNDTTELDYTLVKAKYLQWQILWHYDITAVLKYIANKWKDISRVKIWINKIEYQIWEAKIYEFNTDNKVQNYMSCSYYYIKNKPLYLYTEQEEKDLLDLLTKLKWWPTI